jgi:cell division septal protein FtsQ
MKSRRHTQKLASNVAARHCGHLKWRMQMKTYRLITLIAAVLITVSLLGILSHEKVGEEPQAQSPVVAPAVATPNAP